MRLFLFRGALDALLRDEGLQDARVGVLRVAEVEYLVEQLVDEHEVVLHVLLADLAEVALHHLADLPEELEHHRGVHVLLGHGGDPDVRLLDVKERGARDVGHRRPDLLPGMDDVHSKRIDRVPADVIAIHPTYQHFSLVVVDEQATDHFARLDKSASHRLWLTKRTLEGAIGFAFDFNRFERITRRLDQWTALTITRLNRQKG